MNIRLANAEDESKIAPLMAQFRVELKALKGIKTTPKIELAKEEFYEYVEANYPIYVAENDHHELIGYVVCRIENNVVWAEAIFVDLKFRRQGVAQTLYREVEKLAAQLENETVYNWVHPNNEKVINFLDSMGYDVLNLIELRKPYKDETFTKRIQIEKFNYRY